MNFTKLESLKKFGEISLINGDLKKAVIYLEESLEISKKIFINEHPIIIEILNSLSRIHKEKEEFNIAIDYLNQSNSISNKLFQNKSHILVSSICDLYGEIYCKLDDYDKSFDYFSRSLIIKEDIFKNKKHSSISLSLFNLGILYFKQKQYKECLKSYNRALEIYKELKLKQDKNFIDLNFEMGVVYQELNDTSKALNYFVDILKLSQKLDYRKNEISEKIDQLKINEYLNFTVKLEEILNSKDELNELVGLELLDDYQDSRVLEANIFPSDLSHLLICKDVYGNNMKLNEKIEINHEIWTIFNKFESDAGELENKLFNYKAIAYLNKKNNQLVLAFKGLEATNLKYLKNDNLISCLKETFVNGVIKYQKECFNTVENIIHQARKENYCLSFTGFSNGAWLAENAIFYTLNKHEYEKSKIKGVLFESPGIISDEDEHEHEKYAKLYKIMSDIITNYFLPDSNLINTSKRHLGAMFKVNIMESSIIDSFDEKERFFKYGFYSLFNLECIDKFIDVFKSKKFSSFEKVKYWQMAGLCIKDHNLINIDICENDFLYLPKNIKELELIKNKQLVSKLKSFYFFKKLIPGAHLISMVTYLNELFKNKIDLFLSYDNQALLNQIETGVKELNNEFLSLTINESKVRTVEREEKRDELFIKDHNLDWYLFVLSKYKISSSDNDFIWLNDIKESYTTETDLIKQKIFIYISNNSKFSTIEIIKLNLIRYLDLYPNLDLLDGLSFRDFNQTKSIIYEPFTNKNIKDFIDGQLMKDKKCDAFKILVITVCIGKNYLSYSLLSYLLNKTVYQLLPTINKLKELTILINTKQNKKDVIRLNAELYKLSENVDLNNENELNKLTSQMNKLALYLYRNNKLKILAQYNHNIKELIKNYSSPISNDEVLSLLNKSIYIDIFISCNYNYEIYEINEKLKISNIENLYYSAYTRFILGDYKNAIKFYEYLLNFENNDDLVGNVRVNLGLVHTYLSNYDIGLEYIEKSLKYVNENEEHTFTYSTTLMSLGLYNYYIKQTKRSIDFFDKSISKLNKIKDNEQIKADCYLNKGIALSDLGEYKDAFECFEKTLRLYKTTQMPGGHPSLAYLFMNLGVLFYNIGDYKKSLEYYDRSANIFEKTFKNKHPLIGDLYNNYGNTIFSLGDTRKSINFFNRALEEYKESLDENHISIANTNMNLGISYEDLGDYKAARECFNISLKIKENNSKVNLESIADTILNIGNICLIENDIDEAIDLYEKALKIYVETLPDNHYSKACLLMNMGTAYMSKKNFDIALDNFTKSLEMKKKILPSDHPSIAESKVNLGNLYLILHEEKKSIELFDESLKIYESHLPENHISICHLLMNMGIANVILGDYKKGIEHFMKSLNLNNQKIAYENKTFSLNLYENLINAFRSIKDFKNAIDYFNKKDELKEEFLKKESANINQKIDSVSLHFCYQPIPVYAY